MKRIFVSNNSAEVGFLKTVLEDAGIVCLVRNETQAFTTAFPPELWIVKDEDFVAADKLCRKWRTQPLQEQNRWRCQQCGEEIEDQFYACWKCEKPRVEAEVVDYLVPGDVIDQSEAPPEGDEIHGEDARIARKPFPYWMVIILAILAAMLEMYSRWTYSSGDPVAALSYPVDTALWYAGNQMKLYEGWKDASHLEKRLRSWHDFDQEDLSSLSEEALRDTIAFAQKSDAWMQNVAQLRASLAVLLGESGLNEMCANELAILSSNRNTASFVVVARAIYGTNTIGSRDGLGDPGAVLGDTWFHKKFEARWRGLDGRDVESSALKQSLRNDASEMQQRDLTMIAAATFGQVIGLLALGGLLLHQGRFRPAPDGLAVPWSGWEGLGIFFAAWSLGIVLVAILNRLGLGIVTYFAYHLILWSPLILLLWCRHWTFDQGSIDALCRIRSGSPGALWLIFAGLAVFSLDWLALGSIQDVATRSLGLKSHWADGIYESEIYEPWNVRWILLLDGAVTTPILEELAFRGVLFPALRKWMPMSIAALVSAVVFASAHYYSWPGILALIAFGFVSALATHFTRSLIPSIIGHLLTNLILVAGYSWVLAR
jgi:membrane protease YdiL (CAAX protease family)